MTMLIARENHLIHVWLILTDSFAPEQIGKCFPRFCRASETLILNYRLLEFESAPAWSLKIVGSLSLEIRTDSIVEYWKPIWSNKFTVVFCLNHLILINSMATLKNHEMRH